MTQAWLDSFDPEVRKTFTSEQLRLIKAAPESEAKERNGRVPWQCWDIPHFKACHTEAGHKTYRYLEGEGMHPNAWEYDNPSSPESVAHQKLVKAAWDKLYKSHFNIEKYSCMLKHACTSGMMATVKSGESMEEQEARVNPAGKTLGKVAMSVGLFTVVGYLLYRKFGSK